MSSMDHPGARAPSRPGDLSETVASLINFSSDAMSELSKYDLSTCDHKIEELTMRLNNPTGPPMIIPHVLGQLTLLYQQKAKMQAQEHAEAIRAMQAACQAEENSNSHLRHLIEIPETQDQAVQEHDVLHAQVQDQQKGGNSQTDLASPELLPRKTEELRADVIPGGASGMETLGEQL
ncbi:unnamed protein product [Pleuronectes platessa]|uniref:Uncharacterized protein n=1 Tax=Pleuronectes platessa TaxID=8262 RepID=A0A9N7YUT6_PLEPL|nr:unnamed protein product [Pleuronectes platessa]